MEPHSHSRIKQYIIAIICLLGATIIGWGVIMVLKNLEPTRSDDTPAQVLTSEEIIAQYTTDGAIPGLRAEAYDKQIDQAARATIVYKPTVATYAVTAPAKHTVLFTPKIPNHPDDTTTIQNQTTTFMEQHGLKKTEPPASDSSYIIYENAKTACQLSSANVKNAASTPAFHKLSCAEITIVQEEYTAIDKLLSLYKRDNQTPEFTEASRSLTSEGNKAMAIVTLTGTNKVTSLLFAAIDDNWSYLGNLSDSGAESNGKYSISAEVQQAITDPKWSDFLTRNLQAI